MRRAAPAVQKGTITPLIVRHRLAPRFHGGRLQVGVEIGEPHSHQRHRERRAQHDMADDDPGQRTGDADPRLEGQHGQAEDDDRDGRRQSGSAM